MTARRPCPGPCGRQIQPHLFACSTCWAKLPENLRSQINDAARAYRYEIFEKIQGWFEERRR